MKPNSCCVTLASIAFMLGCHQACGWGVDAHLTISKIAQGRLSKAAEEAVKDLLTAQAEGDLGSMCSGADRVRFRYRWSAPLHYINTPQLCSYKYSRDCKDGDGVAGMCVAGAINNYTSQLHPNLTTEWQDQVEKWESCRPNITACPHIYASEGIKASGRTKALEKTQSWEMNTCCLACPLSTSGLPKEACGWLPSSTAYLSERNPLNWLCSSFSFL